MFVSEYNINMGWDFVILNYRGLGDGSFFFRGVFLQSHKLDAITSIEDDELGNIWKFRITALKGLV